LTIQGRVRGRQPSGRSAVKLKKPPMYFKNKNNKNYLG
jgi:hypothetical protein